MELYNLEETSETTHRQDEDSIEQLWEEYNSD